MTSISINLEKFLNCDHLASLKDTILIITKTFVEPRNIATPLPHYITAVAGAEGPHGLRL